MQRTYLGLVVGLGLLDIIGKADGKSLECFTRSDSGQACQVLRSRNVTTEDCVVSTCSANENSCSRVTYEDAESGDVLVTLLLGCHFSGGYRCRGYFMDG